MSMQKITIIGNLGRDPELKELGNGSTVCNMTVATNRTWNSTNEEGNTVRNKETTWFNAETWGDQAKVCAQYLKQGSRVYIEGRLKQAANYSGPRTWMTAEGEPRAAFEVRISNIIFLSSNNEPQSNGNVTQEVVQDEEESIEF